MGIQVLGPLTGDGSGRLGPHDRVVLQALATRPGQPVSADQLIDAVWGERPPASAAKNIQSCVVKLRKLLGPQAIETSPHGYVLVVPPDGVDAQAFEAQVTRARELLTLGENDRVAYLLDQALSLWRGPAFPDLPDWPPARRAAGRLDELRLEAQEMYVEAMLRSGRAREVLAQAHALVRAAPLRERRWELLVLAQYQTGAQGEALRSLRELRAVLARELGIDPSPEMLALEQSILAQDPRLLVPPQPQVRAAQCPWQGLMAYDVDDTERFFGRDTDVAACLSILDRGSFVALVGPSGSGKSSLLRAGLLATLRRRGHQVVLVTPGRRPMRSLSALGMDAPPSTVLAVDQGEEVFALCDDPKERRTFLERLAEEARRRPVLVTMRGDRLGQVTEHAGFSRLVEGGLHLVGALDEQGLRQAIERPAAQAGLVIEHGLVDVLVREVRDVPGALPLLSHALLETWQRREGSTLTVDGYRASGGIHGAIAQSAEQLYGQLEPAQRRQLRDLVLRLVSRGADGEAVRTRVPRRLVAPAHDELVEALVAARLVTSDHGVLEITHEALTRAWPRLRGWLDDDVEGQRIRHHLSGAADAWDTLGRPDSELYRGVRLTRALDWQSRTESTLTDVEREFLEAARSASEAEAQSAAQRARAQARLIRRLRIVLGGAAVLLILALAAGGMAVVQSDRAGDNATRAQHSAISALARGAASRGALADTDTKMLLAAAGVVLDESPATVANLQQVITANPELIRSMPLAREQTKALDAYPDGRRAAVLDDTRSLSVVDLTSGKELARRQIGPAQAEEDARRILRVSPDGRLVAVAAAPFSDRLLHLLDARTLEPVSPQPRGLPPGSWQLMDAQFSQDGTTLAVVVGRLVRRDGWWTPAGPRAYVWTVASAAKPAVVDLARWRHGWASAALSPDGSLLYTATPTVRVHDLETGRTRLLSAQDDAPGEAGLEVSPDGRQLVLARGFLGSDAVLLDAATGRVRHTLPNDSPTFDARFSTDGRRVMTVTYRPTVVSVWDSDTGTRITRFSIPTSEPDAVDLVGVGDRVISATTGRALHHWDVDGDRRYLRRIPLARSPWGSEAPGACFVNPSPGGEYVHYSLCDESGVVLDVGERALHPAHTPGRGYNFGDGSWYAPRAEFLNAIGGTIYTWDGETGGVRAGPHPLGNRITGIKHSPDGSRVVVSDHTGMITLLEAGSLEPVGRQVDLGANACCAVLGPDNRTAFVLVGPADRVRFWKRFPSAWALVDLEEGRIVDEGTLGMENGIWAAYSPDGRHVAVGGYDGEVAIIDTETGQLVREPLRAHANGVFWLAFSKDGSRLVSGASDNTAVVWNVETGRVISRVPVPQEGLASSTFLANGDIMIVPWGGDAAFYLWDLSATRAVEFACRAAGRDITEAEWAEHFPGQPFRSVCPQD